MRSLGSVAPRSEPGSSGTSGARGDATATVTTRPSA